MDIAGYILIGILVLIVIDLVVAGGAVTATCVGAVAGVMAHPVMWLVVLVVAGIFLAGIAAFAWP